MPQSPSKHVIVPERPQLIFPSLQQAVLQLHGPEPSSRISRASLHFIVPPPRPWVDPSCRFSHCTEAPRPYHAPIVFRSWCYAPLPWAHLQNPVPRCECWWGGAGRKPGWRDDSALGFSDGLWAMTRDRRGLTSASSNMRCFCYWRTYFHLTFRDKSIPTTLK